MAGRQGTCRAHRSRSRRALLTWRSLGPGWGIRRVRASPRARCAPPAAAARRPQRWPPRWRLHSHHRAGRGPGKRVQLARQLLRPRSSQWLPAFPARVRAPFLCGRPFPPLGRTGQTGFSAPGGASGLLSAAASAGSGARPDRRPCLPVPPGGGREPDVESPETGRRGPGPVPSPVRSGGRWAPWPRSSSVPRPRPGRSRLLGRPRLPGDALATPPRPSRVTFRCPRLARPRLGSVTAPARKLARPQLRLGPELPR